MSPRLSFSELESEPVGRFCKRCGKRIPRTSDNDLCRNCLKDTIFPKVRDYVRKNEVSEYELSEIFGISKDIVHEWVTEGHLEYKNE